MAARRRVIGSISILGDADDTGIDQAGKLGARQRQALRQYFLAMLAVARCGARRLAFPLRQGRKGARGGIGETAGIVGVAEERIVGDERRVLDRSEEHTSELQSLMRISYAVFCLKKKTKTTIIHRTHIYKI